MEGEYPVYLAGNKAGTAVVKREGLYWKIRCTCQITGDVLYKVTVKSEQEQQSLGILVPEGEHFVLSTRISAKRLGNGTLTFCALPKHSDLTGRFIPIYPDEPFAYLDRLKKARFMCRDQQPGLLVKE